MRKLLEKIRKILKDRRTRQLLTRTVSVTAAIVVFVTTYALVLPAITMEKVAECGVEEHQHDDSCYTDKLICEIPESPGHQHTDECYSVSTVLVCQAREHIHSVENGCYDEDGNLICGIQEHTHSVDNGCYEEVRELTCGLEESEGHTHDASCYQKVLTCGKEIHTHSTACYRIDAASAMATEAAAVASTEFASLANTTSTAAEPSESTAMTESKESTPEVSSNDGLFDPADNASATTTSVEPAKTIDEGNYEFTADGSSTVMNSDGTAEFVDDGSSTDAVSTNKEANNSVTSSSTGSTAKAVAAGYVPVLDALNFNVILNNRTGIYCCHPASDDALTDNDASDDVSFEDARFDDAAGDIEGTSDDRKTGTSTDTVIDSSTIPAEEWHRIPNNNEHDTEHEDTSELGESDLLRVYLAYTIPAGSLNETNTVAKYRLPGNIRLTDDQVNQINKTVNGISNQYVDMSTLEITDADQYNRYLGIEAVEGTRTPDRDVQDYLTDLERSGKDATEYISAVVRVEDVYNELTGENEGQDLIFTFAPYTVLKNQHEYDGNGQPIKAGEEVSGWVSLDLRTDQIEWETTGDSDNAEQNESKVEKTASIVFVEKNQELGVEEIRTELKIIEKSIIDNETDNHTDDAEQTDGSVDKKDASDCEDGKGNYTESTKPVVNYPAVTFRDSITTSMGSLSTDTETGRSAELPEQAELTVYVEADRGTFPEGTTMRLSTVNDMDSVASAVEEAVITDDAVSNKTCGFHAVDISFWNTEGIEIEPLKPIRVSITSESIKKAVEDASTAAVVLHIADSAGNQSTTDVSEENISDKEEVDDSGKVKKAADQETTEGIKNEVPVNEKNDYDSPSATIVETEKQSSTENSETNDIGTLTFEAEAFSVYAIVYTVDFHYEINGKTYDFSIPGGGFVSLEHLVEVLGIASADENAENGTKNAENDMDDMTDSVGEVPGAVVNGENGEGSEDKSADGGVNPSSDSTACQDTIKFNEVEVSEATKKFVADVENVEFSSPELVWAGKVDEATKVRDIKESKELEVKYSGGLTVKDISKINAQGVEAGDWALISVQPFEDDQTLTVTMKNGEKYAIHVAGQVHSEDVRVQYTYADGDTVVTACAPEGTLPEGTKIQIREIDPYTDFSEDIEEEAKLYAEAREAVANKLWEEHRTLGESKVVDISFIDPNGKEIEPEGDVDVSLMLAEALKADDGENPSLAHISDGEKTETEFLEAEIDGKEAVFTSDAFSIYVIFNNGAYTGTLQPVNFDTGWISFGGDMQARNELPNGALNRVLNLYPSPEGAWKWLTVNLYELKEGVSEDNYLNSDSYNLLDSYSYIAGNTDIVVEDYNFGAREVLCTAFRGSGSTDWKLYDAKNGDETKVNYGGNPLQYHWNDIMPYWFGYWDQEANVLNIHLTREKEVVREPSTDYVIRYYHADGTYDTVTGSLTSSNTSLSLPADYKIIDGREIFSGLSIGAGHSALSANTSTGAMTISYNRNVSLVKANVYYKENIEIKDGGPVSGQPQYDTKNENGRKIYDTSRTGLHTDKTATPITNSANAALNDGRTFNLTLESWNVGANYANVGMILDASGSMVWPSDLPEEVKVPTNTLSSYGSKTTKSIKTGNGSSTTSVTGYFLTAEQVNNILNTNYVDNSKLGYNGYRYYLKDPAANVNEYVPLGYYDGSNSNGVSFAPSSGTKTRGWYYVTSADVSHYQTDGTGKQYCSFSNNNDAWQGAGSTATQFWLDDEGVLHGYWYRGDNYWNSKVYVSPANADNKSEVLQYGLGRFAATLMANSPTSQISMVRFSRARKNSYFTAAELALLNWTTDTKLVTAAMNQQYGDGTSTGHDSQNGLNVYNYGFTGDTSTGSGIDAYINDLTKKAAGNYVATSGNANNSKYLIIFTDGKDTDPATSNNNYRFDRAKSKTEATNLKNQGYTIFTVMMQSAGMSTSDVSDAENFLRGLAGTKTEDGDATNSDGSDKYYFNFMYDDPTALVEAFQKIAKEIAKPLDGYMVRDYIDPRFDLLDVDGNVLTRLNRNGVWMPRFITTTDGKSALLKYDTEKEMFYLEIENQSIPTSPQNATDVTVNTVQLTVRAKDDFIGGNDILSNGNEDWQNQVFKPVDDYAIEVNEPVAANPDTSTYPKKDYPKTTTNPATYGTTLLNYEDTIFLNETISPIDLFGQVSTMDDETADDNHLNVYAGYLSRAGKRLHDDENYYVNILQNGVLPGGHQNVNGEVITTTDKIVTIKLPYYYLKDENNIRSYAGGNLHQGDKVGTITYTWKAINTGVHTLTDNIAFKDYMSTTLDTVKYQLSISYTPDPVVSNDNIANNGSARTLALTNQTGTDKLIRDPVGNVAVSQSTDTDSEGLAVIHVEGGKIGITKKISKQDLDDKGITVSDLPNVTFTITKDGTSYKTVTAVMSQSTLSNGYYELTVWETDLPKGTYTVSEAAGDGYKLDSFDAVTVQDDSSTTAVNESQFAAKYSKDSDSKTVTWYIGPKEEAADRQPDVSTYSDCVNGTVLFPYNLVADSVYHVDPDLAADNGKHYLNGQIGQAVYINKLNPLVMLRKADMTNTSKPVNGAEFSFYKEVEEETAGALTDVISGKSVIAVSEVTSGEYIQMQGTDQGENLAGYVSLGDLDTDGTYYLVEKSVPDGYISPEWKYVKINLTDTQISWAAYKEDGSIHGSPQSASKETVDGKKCFTVTILNNPGVSLPNTGGPGTTTLYFLGIMLIGLAGAGLMMRWRISLLLIPLFSK